MTLFVILIIINIFIFFVLVYLFRFWLSKNFKVPDIFIRTKLDLLIQIFLCVLFFCYFFFYLRILRFLKCNYNDLNLKSWFNCVYERMFFSYERIFVFFFVLLIVCVVIFFFYLLNYYIYFNLKLNFLKLHYFYFHKNSCYVKFLKNVNYFELLLVKKKKIYLILVFLIKYGFKIYISIFFMKNLYFDHGIININYLPYYSLYYVVYNTYEFFLLRLQEDFEIAIISEYYRQINFLKEKNSWKIQQYLKFLFLGFSKFKFQDSIYLEFPEKIQKNWLIYNIFKYNLNKYPNDFYSRIKNIYPEYFKK